MSGLYLVTVTVHVLAALLWLGGMLALALIGAPVLRQVEPPALRQELFRKMGERFLWIAWLCIAVLLVTGLLNLHFRGVLSPSVLGDPSFWSGRYGRALGWKLACVVIMVGVAAIHDFIVGPAASRSPAGSPQALRLRRRAALLARFNAGVGVVLVVVAVRLARGG